MFIDTATAAIITTIVTAVCALIGLYINKKFKFIQKLRKSFVIEENTIEPETALEETERLLKTQAATILNVVRPYQKDDPITVFDLHKRLVDRKETELDFEAFQKALSALIVQDKLPGLVREHDNLFIHEEHISWKKNIGRHEKRKIAEKAYSFIKSGDVVALDAGTTTLEIAKLIAKGFKDHSLRKITVVTSSFLVADAIVTACSELGLEDHDPMFRLFIIGGRVRLNTMAIVDDNESVEEDIFHDFDKVLPSLGGADIGFVGTNGILKNVGFTTADSGEKRAKASLLRYCKSKYIVCTEDKFGLRQSQIFAEFNENIKIISAETNGGRLLKDYQKYFDNHQTDIILA